MAAAGQLITVFALAYALASPVAASLFGAVERRRLMMRAMLVFALGNVVVAVSDSYPVLMAGRLIAALAAAAFTPTALMVAGMTAPAESRGRVKAPGALLVQGADEDFWYAAQPEAADGE